MCIANNKERRGLAAFKFSLPHTTWSSGMAVSVPSVIYPLTVPNANATYPNPTAVDALPTR